MMAGLRVGSWLIRMPSERRNSGIGSSVWRALSVAASRLPSCISTKASRIWSLVGSRLGRATTETKQNTPVAARGVFGKRIDSGLLLEGVGIRQVLGRLLV